MNKKYWHILVGIVGVLAIFSYALFFTEVTTFQPIAGMPAKLLLGIIVTVLLVLLTYLGQRIFPYHDINKTTHE